MKRIIIFLLLVIVAIMGYNQYAKYKRFNPPGVSYQTAQTIDANYHDQGVVMEYREAIARLEGFIVQAWSFHGIDVRNPKKDNAATNAVVSTYAEHLARVTFYESKLAASATYKSEGLTNSDIIRIESGEAVTDNSKAAIKKDHLKALLEDSPNVFNLGIGAEGALVYELQLLLTTKGYTLQTDGVYQIETVTALTHFEAAKGLYADGVLDPLTMHYLLND